MAWDFDAWNKAIEGGSRTIGQYVDLRLSEVEEVSPKKLREFYEQLITETTHDDVNWVTSLHLVQHIERKSPDLLGWISAIDDPKEALWVLHLLRYSRIDQIRLGSIAALIQRKFPNPSVSHEVLREIRQAKESAQERYAWSLLPSQEKAARLRAAQHETPHTAKGGTRVHEGDSNYPDPKDLPMVPKDAEIYYLGSGGSGKAYRIVTAHGEYVLKKYSSSEIMEGDLEKLDLLRKILGKPGKTESQQQQFRLVKYEKVAPSVLKSDFVRGRRLGEYFRERRNPIDKEEFPELDRIRETGVIAFLRQRYFDRLESMVRSVSEYHQLTYPASYDGEIKIKDSDIHLYLHDSNVIVDPVTLEMTIVDPY